MLAHPIFTFCFGCETQEYIRRRIELTYCYAYTIPACGYLYRLSGNDSNQQALISNQELTSDKTINRSEKDSA